MEIISGAILLLLVFTLITLYSYEKNLDIEAMEKYIESKGDCKGIADVISSVYASGKKTSIEFYSEKDFNMQDKWVDVTGFSCYHYAKVVPVYISKGNVRIKDLNGVVVAENY